MITINAISSSIYGHVLCTGHNAKHALFIFSLNLFNSIMRQVFYFPTHLTRPFSFWRYSFEFRSLFLTDLAASNLFLQPSWIDLPLHRPSFLTGQPHPLTRSGSWSPAPRCAPPFPTSRALPNLIVLLIPLVSLLSRGSPHPQPMLSAGIFCAFAHASPTPWNVHSPFDRTAYSLILVDNLVS